MKVLFCGITDARDECGIEFAIMVLQLPFKQAFERFHLVFSRSPKDAVDAFVKTSEFDVLICCPATRASESFVLKALSSDHATKAIILGIEPVPVIDWERLAEGLPATRLMISEEDLKQHTRSKDMLCQLKAPAYDFVASFPKTAFVLKKKGGKFKAASPVWVDVENIFSVTEKVEFAGCVKYRFIA